MAAGGVQKMRLNMQTKHCSAKCEKQDMVSGRVHHGGCMYEVSYFHTPKSLGV